MGFTGGRRELTAQDVYFARLWWLRRNGTADDVARFAASGPPPPVAADGYWGALAYYEFHAPNDARCAREYARLRAEGPPRLSGRIGEGDQ